jgi:iron complex transport system ATP-binding protein
MIPGAEPVSPLATAPPALRLDGIRHRYAPEGPAVVHDVDLEIRAGEHWVVLGPNGCGKSTLARIAALRLHPSRGDVEVLGQRLGRIDLRDVRPAVGYTSAALTTMLRPTLTAADAVMTARRDALEPWWHVYDDDDRAAAEHALDAVGGASLASRTLGSLSSGERQRVLLARALVHDPVLLVGDEPAAGLDLGAREDLLSTLDDLSERAGVASLVITHHVEEIASSATHALLLRAGGPVAQGPLGDTLTAESLSATFGRAVALTRVDGRWTARADIG